MALGDPFRLLEALNRHRVPFVVIGGHAVNFHGFVRATEDTDVIILRSLDCERAVLGALTEVNAKWISDELDPTTGIERTYPVSAAYIRANRLMMLVTDHGFLEIFDFVPGYPHTDVAESESAHWAKAGSGGRTKKTTGTRRSG